jgi:tetratricopeptide (TPR) repeat protein
MIVRHAVGFTVLLLSAASVAAGQDRWIVPKCDLKPGHHMVNGGLLYLKNATNTNFQAQREKDLRDAHRTLKEAITQNGQDKNGAAWYYLGRYYGLSNDLAGADSAFRRAQALVPGCKDDITTWRKTLWTPVFNQGVQAYNAGKSDSAIYFFGLAAAIYPEPIGTAALASLYANSNQVDSALKYYSRTAEIAGADTQYTKERREALYNQAALLYSVAGSSVEQEQHQRWSDAAAAFQTYLKSYPGDVQAMAALASSYTRLKQPDSAMALYRQIVAKADSADPAALFAAGAAMFNSAPEQPDTATTAAACRKSAKTPAERRTCDQNARAAFARHDSVTKVTYRLAARAFEAGLARSPYSRDGLYNSVSTYYLLGDTAKVVPVARRLVAVDPMNRAALRLAAAAHQMKGSVDSTVHYVTVAESTLVVDVTVQSFRITEESASFSAIVTNFHAKPSPPVKLTIEFLNAKGDVVASQPAEVPAQQPNGMFDLQAQAIGVGIAAWRYKKAS